MATTAEVAALVAEADLAVVLHEAATRPDVVAVPRRRRLDPGRGRTRGRDHRRGARRASAPRTSYGWGSRCCARRPPGSPRWPRCCRGPRAGARLGPSRSRRKSSTFASGISHGLSRSRAVDAVEVRADHVTAVQRLGEHAARTGRRRHRPRDAVPAPSYVTTDQPTGTRSKSAFSSSTAPWCSAGTNLSRVSEVRESPRLDAKYVEQTCTGSRNASARGSPTGGWATPRASWGRWSRRSTAASRVEEARRRQVRNDLAGGEHGDRGPGRWSRWRRPARRDHTGTEHSFDWVPLVESLVNDLIFATLAVVFLWALPERLERRVAPGPAPPAPVAGPRRRHAPARQGPGAGPGGLRADRRRARRSG